MATNFPSSPSVDDTFTSAGVTYTWDGTVWKATGSGEFVATVTTGDTAPTSPSDGDLWYRTSDGRTYVYYNDGSSSQWVDANPNLPPDPDTFDRSGTDVTLVNSGDNVGIGATPAVKLDVNGEIRASTGILFGTDTAAANTLDDYEEGTWTPVYAGDTTAGTYTYTSQTGGYTKIGNRVTVDFKLLNITTSSVGSGDVRITGLPFTVGTTGLNAQGSIRMSRFDVDDSTVNISLQANQNTTECQITLTRDNNSNVTVNVNDKTTDGADIYGSITYNVD